MIYEQFIVSIVELIMLSWQPILLYNFHNMTVIWLFCHLFKLQVYILNGLENISIFNIWKLWLVRCDVIFGETSLILPKISENFWSKVIPLWWFPGLTLKLNNSRTAWPIPAIYISFSSILNALSYEINLFSRCSSPLNSIQFSGVFYSHKMFRFWYPFFFCSYDWINDIKMQNVKQNWIMRFHNTQHWPNSLQLNCAWLKFSLIF